MQCTQQRHVALVRQRAAGHLHKDALCWMGSSAALYVEALSGQLRPLRQVRALHTSHAIQTVLVQATRQGAHGAALCGYANHSRGLPQDPLA